MIGLKNILVEVKNSRTNTAGCLMAMVDDEYCANIIKFGNKLIPDDTLYTAEPGFGREHECHVTVKFGFKPDLNELDIRRIIQGVKPFMITLNDITTFKNDKFTVVKFDVESDVLVKMNTKSNDFPHEDAFPVYHPHLTIAYVNPGTWQHEKIDVNIKVPIHRLCYSPMSGAKTFYSLKDD